MFSISVFVAAKNNTLGYDHMKLVSEIKPIVSVVESGNLVLITYSKTQLYLKF